VSACACVFGVVHAICSAFIANQLFPPLPPLLSFFPPSSFSFSTPIAVSCRDLLFSVVDVELMIIFDGVN